MGCFNKTAFYSHLPITYGDEIVMFVFSNQYSLSKIGCTPINPNGKGYSPIAAPFFGEYDDYGTIENVIDDANHQLFTKKIGMPLTEFCDIMEDLGGFTLKELKDGIEALKKDDSNKNEYHHKTIEDYEKLLKIYESLIGFSIPTYEEFGVDEQSKKIAKQMYEYEIERYNSFSLSVGMEHKSIYDKMVEIAKANYFNDYYGKKVTIEDAFDNTVKSISNFENLSEEKKNILKNFIPSNPIKYGVYKCEMEDFLGIKACIGDTVSFDKADYCLYNKITLDELNSLKENIIEYLYFLKAYKRTSTTFDLSPYHSQTVSYDVLIPLYEKMVEILKENAKINE